MVENLIRLGSSMIYYNLASKNSNLSKVRSSLEEKKKIELKCVKSLKGNNSSMTDIILLKIHQILPNVRLSNSTESSTNFLLTYESGDTSVKLFRNP